MPRRRSPQEKKRLSYARDRRNWYGENDKSSRRNVARAKSRVRRANRRGEAMALSRARGTAGPDAGAAAQERFERRRPKRWSKWPDDPLWVTVQSKLRDRVAAEGGRGASAERLHRLRQRMRRPDR